MIKRKWEQFLSLEAEIEKELRALAKKNVSEIVDGASGVKTEFIPGDFIDSVHAMSSLEGAAPASTKDVKTSPTANETSDESVLDSNKNEIGIAKDEDIRNSQRRRLLVTNLVLLTLTRSSLEKWGTYLSEK